MKQWPPICSNSISVIFPTKQPQWGELFNLLSLGIGFLKLL